MDVVSSPFIPEPYVEKDKSNYYTDTRISLDTETYSPPQTEIQMMSQSCLRLRTSHNPQMERNSGHGPVAEFFVPINLQ